MEFAPISTQTFNNTTIPTKTYLPTTDQTLAVIKTLTPYRTNTPTLTHVPTLTISQFRNKVFELLENNGGCKLPCWWGIEPGSTSWEETRSIFTKLGSTSGDVTMPDGNVYHWIGGPYWEWNNTFIGIGFHDQDGTVTAVDVDAEGYYDQTFFHTLWKNYSPEQINSTYGPPTRVWIGLSGSESGSTFYWIYIFYDNLGFVSGYKGQALVSDENGTPMYKICPTWQDPVWLPDIKIFLQSPESNKPLENLADINPSSWKSINDASGITSDDFYNLLLPGNTPACFYTPQSTWK
jgi:hypothetical protein